MVRNTSISDTQQQVQLAPVPGSAPVTAVCHRRVPPIVTPPTRRNSHSTSFPAMSLHLPGVSSGSVHQQRQGATGHFGKSVTQPGTPTGLCTLSPVTGLDTSPPPHCPQSGEMRINTNTTSSFEPGSGCGTTGINPRAACRRSLSVCTPPQCGTGATRARPSGLTIRNPTTSETPRSMGGHRRPRALSLSGGGSGGAGAGAGAPGPARGFRAERRCTSTPARSYRCTPCGKLRLQRLIGSGSDGKVFLASSLPTSHGNNATAALYAVKVAPSSSLTMQNEAYLLTRRLPPHAHLVAVPRGVSVSVDDMSNTMYLPLQYVRGGDLVSFMDDYRHGLDAEVVAKVGGQVASALQHCHSHGVFHRDVKPENVLVESVGQDGVPSVRLADFGSATMAPYPHLCTTTPSFAAPEAISCSASRDTTESCPGAADAVHPDGRYDAAAADVWSLGVTLFCLLRGRQPWGHAVPTDVHFGTFVTTGKFYTDNSAACKDDNYVALLRFLKRMMDVHPAARPSMEEVVTSLQRLFTPPSPDVELEDGTMPRSPPTPTRPSPSTQTRRDAPASPISSMMQLLQCQPSVDATTPHTTHQVAFHQRFMPRGCGAPVTPMAAPRAVHQPSSAVGDDDAADDATDDGDDGDDGDVDVDMNDDDDVDMDAMDVPMS